MRACLGSGTNWGMKPILTALCLFALIACKADETLAGYGAADRVWVLAELDGATFAAKATMQFPEPGKISGDAPCNRYSGAVTAPYPWFEAGNLAVTRMACPELAAESALFDALSGMTQSEVSGDTLILTNEAGREMVFKASD
ncbi:MAG: heat shock protein HslJ [Paracoccaceae bacterium]